MPMAYTQLENIFFPHLSICYFNCQRSKPDGLPLKFFTFTVSPEKNIRYECVLRGAHWKRNIFLITLLAQLTISVFLPTVSSLKKFYLLLCHPVYKKFKLSAKENIKYWVMYGPRRYHYCFGILHSWAGLPLQSYIQLYKICVSQS